LSDQYRPSFLWNKQSPFQICCFGNHWTDKKSTLITILIACENKFSKNMWWHYRLVFLDAVYLIELARLYLLILTVNK
jgi:hypothetical protein